MSITKTEIKKIVEKEIENYINSKLDDEIHKAIKKSKSKTREEVLDIMKNSLESVFKVLWQKRNFWKTDIK